MYPSKGSASRASDASDGSDDERRILIAPIESDMGHATGMAENRRRPFDSSFPDKLRGLLAIVLCRQ